jgi:hypothetical protein
MAAVSASVSGKILCTLDAQREDRNMYQDDTFAEGKLDEVGDKRFFLQGPVITGPAISGAC